jgi:hypothetical protein
LSKWAAQSFATKLTPSTAAGDLFDKRRRLIEAIRIYTAQTRLQTIASIWQVDDSAIKWVDDGFDWSPGSHLVRVRALPNGKSVAEDRWRVSVQTDFLASVPIEDKKFVELIASQSGP